MMNAAGNGDASTSNSGPKNINVAMTVLTETSASSSMKTNLEETVVVSESEEKVEMSMEEVEKEKNAVVMNNIEDTIKENNRENETEDGEKNEENLVEEEEEEENAIEEEEESDEETAIEEEEEKNDEEIAIEEEEQDEKVANEEQNEEKVEAKLKEKVKKSRKRGRRGRRSKTAQRGPEIVTTKDEDKPESRKRSRRTEVAKGGSKTVATKNEDKPESSRKKKAVNKAASMGMIFMCSSKTKKDCYRYKVFGLPASKRDMVQKVYKGMRLFLFDVDLRLMYGIYKAAGPGGYNIEAKAFNSAFPSQVRFTILEDCLPLAEEKFKKVINDNYYTRNKFNCQLTSEQVKKLCKLFVASSKGPKSKSSSRRAETRTFVDRDRIRQRAVDEERRSALREERRYHEHPVMYERGVFASPVAPLPRVLALPPPVSGPPYAYERSLEMDAYRRDQLLERRDVWRLDLETRHRDDIGNHDSYIMYREPPVYRDPLYSAGLPPEYHRAPTLPSEYRSVGPAVDYHSSAASLNKYHPPGPLYRY